MNDDIQHARLMELLEEFRNFSKEPEYVEFKHNRADADEIGEYIAALSNAAVLADKSHGYLIWGIEDKTHRIVGTSFRPGSAKVGEEELENWLIRHLSPQVDFQFFAIESDGRHIVVLEIERASHRPVQFKKQEFIRVGSYKKKLNDFPVKARKLWLSFDATPFEQSVAKEGVSAEEVLRLIDYPSYFDLFAQPLPVDRTGILEALEVDRLIGKVGTNRWNVLNLGAILLAKRLSDFPKLQRKAVRVIVYRGAGRVETIKEQEGGRGYAAGFEGLIGYINNLLPSNEIVGQALRRQVPVYPELAVRELVANALIHQDFQVTGAGPMIEIFDDRMEITNPGEPLVEPERFLDKPPRSRNEALASFMRRIGVCEERGGGVDKIVSETELYQLPAPKFESVGENTRTSLFAPKPLSKMDKLDRIRACYLHACLKRVSNDPMSNASLRKRLGIGPKNRGAASRIIRQTIEEGLVKLYDESAGKKHMRYVPYWA